MLSQAVSSPRPLALGIAAATLFISFLASAQQTSLPKPSRTAFKCVVAGKVTYSDDPCLGAERVDLQPSRGVSKNSGRELVGADVRSEHQREQFAEAVRPLTGKSTEQLELQRRRFYLPPEAKRECELLDRSIPKAEAEERVAPAEARAAVQTKLHALRSSHRRLKC